MKHGSHSRRDALKLLGAGTALYTCGPVRASSSSGGPGPVTCFGLGEVRLLPSRFLDAQRRDADYLLKLEPDRMLHNFLVNAGLEPKAPVYGGWESVEPWIEIRCHGHTLGHYLGAAACMYESTGDTRFAERVDYIVSELAQCQAKTGGWLTAFPDGVAPLTDSLAGKSFAGVPWYTTHKVLAGLRDAHVHRGSSAALDLLVKFSDWIDAACRDVPDDRMQKMLDREHGGMNEVLADLYFLTKQDRYRALAVRFSHRAVLAPLAAGKDALDGLHANTQIPKIIGFQRLYEATGESDYGDAATFFWRTVTKGRSFVTGGHGDGEHFFPVNQFAAHLGSAKTMETCCTHNMLRLSRDLYRNSNSTAYLDYFERGLFNAILGSQDSVSGMTTYFQATRPGYVKLFHTPFDSFWCCTGSGMENHARYAETVFARNADTLFVNLFIAASLNWRERGLSFELETRFPDEDTSRLVVKSGKPQRLSVAVRHPSWCREMTLSVNGRREPIHSAAGGYAFLDRRFKAGDVIEIHTPMALSVEALPGAPDHAALLYGPIALAGIFYGNPVKSADQLIVNERESGKMLNDTVPMPRWTRPLEELIANTRRTNSRDLVFLTRGFDDGASVKLIPWSRVSNERYNLYWQRSSAAS
jgi:uncharacterized protein